MENKEITDKILSAESYIDTIYNGERFDHINITKDRIIKLLNDYSAINRDFHLTKQAEVIAEKDNKLKKLKKAIKLIVENFPEEVIQDQLGEDYDKFQKLIK